MRPPRGDLLSKQDAGPILRRMWRSLFSVRWLAAAILMIAAYVLPSAAYAHSGHWSETRAIGLAKHIDGRCAENFSDLDVPVSALYLLAAPSTPELARAEIIRRPLARIHGSPARRCERSPAARC